jgi:hypothetical protein
MMKKIADQFAHVMCKELQKQKDFKNSLTWELGGPKGWNIGHQSADVSGYTLKSKNPIVLIEIERRRDAPVSNVVKVWSWIIEQQKKEKLQKRPILIQAFSGRYSETNTQRKLAELIGKQMEKARVAIYIPIPFDYKPKKNAKNCEGACQGHAKRLAGQIVKPLKVKLKSS